MIGSQTPGAGWVEPHICSMCYFEGFSSPQQARVQQTELFSTPAAANHFTCCTNHLMPLPTAFC